MAHTPGPWIVFHSDEDGPNDVLPAMRAGHIALSIPVDADARLIAAAPDLFDALQRMVREATCMKTDPHDCPFDQARRALNKATGWREPHELEAVHG